MKSKLFCFLTAMLLLCTLAAHAQFPVTDLSSIAQGIVNSTNQMYQHTQTAATIAKNFTETQKIYEQGKKYYDKLRAVNNLVRSARKVQECILMVGDVSDMYMNSYPKFLEDPHFNASELSAISHSYSQLLQRSANSLKDLQTVINPSSLSMTDKDRLDVLDKCHAELLHIRDLTGYFTRKMQSVAAIRTYKENEKKRGLSLYGTDEEKYW